MLVVNAIFYPTTIATSNSLTSPTTNSPSPPLSPPTPTTTTATAAATTTTTTTTAAAATTTTTTTTAAANDRYIRDKKRILNPVRSGTYVRYVNLNCSQTTHRSHKSRSMAFNPVDHGLFAVCSADLSVDLWRYNRRGNEMSKVSDRNDATPVGGVSDPEV